MLYYGYAMYPFYYMLILYCTMVYVSFFTLYTALKIIPIFFYLCTSILLLYSLPAVRGYNFLLYVVTGHGFQ
jgi:hypothetical protein